MCCACAFPSLISLLPLPLLLLLLLLLYYYHHHEDDREGCSYYDIQPLMVTELLVTKARKALSSQTANPPPPPPLPKNRNRINKQQSPTRPTHMTLRSRLRSTGNLHGFSGGGVLPEAHWDFRFRAPWFQVALKGPFRV